MKISNSATSLLLLLPLLTLVPNPSFSPIDSPSTESNLNESGSSLREPIFPGLSDTSDNMTDSNSLSLGDENERLAQLQRQGEQEQRERILQQQRQGNWTTYEDPILGIQFEHPSWWEKRQEENLIKFYPLGTGRYGNYEVFANVHF